MNPSIEIVGNFVCLYFILIAAYGALKQKSELLLFGVCFFGTLPIIGEGIAYAKDDNMLHLVIVMMFFVQVIITLPTNLRYGDKNKAVEVLNKKIGFAVLAINLFQGYLILSEVLDVPSQFGYVHFTFSLIMLCSVIRPEQRV